MSWSEKRSCPEELLTVFLRSDCSIEVSLWKCRYFEKQTAAKNWMFWKSSYSKKVATMKEVAALKK